MISLSDVTLRFSLPPVADDAATRSRRQWRRLMLAALVAANIFGSEAAHSAVPVVFDHQLLMLMHLMAVIKGGMAAAALVLVDWRLARPIKRRLGFGYCAAVAMMTAPVAPIWYAAHLVAAAALFHAGLLTFLALAYVDRGSAPDMLADIAAFRTAR